MTQPWPPPPDLASLKELVAAADVESFIAQGAPGDEYDTEAEALLAHVKDLPTAQLTPATLLPILEAIWEQSFSLESSEMDSRRWALGELAAQIARFFGPEAQPLVRS